MNLTDEDRHGQDAPSPPEPDAKIVLWPNGEVTIEWPYTVRDRLPIDRSEAVTKAAKATQDGWDPR